MTVYFMHFNEKKTHHSRRLLATSGLDLKALIVQICADIGIRDFRIKRAYVLDETPHSGLDRQAVRLILILLYLAYNLRDFSPLAEVYQRALGQEVRIALLDVQYIGQVHAEEGHAGWIDRAQLLLVLLEVGNVQLVGVRESFVETRRDLLEGTVQTVD